MAKIKQSVGKLLSMWEASSKDEIDVWYTLERK